MPLQDVSKVRSVFQSSLWASPVVLKNWLENVKLKVRNPYSARAQDGPQEMERN